MITAGLESAGNSHASCVLQAANEKPPISDVDPGGQNLCKGHAIRRPCGGRLVTLGDRFGVGSGSWSR